MRGGLLHLCELNNFQLVNGANFNRIVATLDPRTVMLGLRFQF